MTVDTALTGPWGEALLRPATAEDLPALVDLLADDQLGAARDGIRDEADLAAYQGALAAIRADPAQLLVVAEVGGAVVGMFQLTVIPGLARRGSSRAQLEAVRVGRAVRGHGLGEAMMRWAIDRAGQHGCSLVQLTTDKTRSDAHRFYRRLGFEASHEGMKLRL